MSPTRQEPGAPERPGATRRSLVKFAAAATGVAAVAGVSGLAGCGRSKSGSVSESKQVTVGSNYSDKVPAAAFARSLAVAQAQAGVAAKVNTVDHNTFQENINHYLQGRPDDVFAWFSGYRMRFFAAKGLAGQLDDVWDRIGANFSPAMKGASTGDDGHQYLIPYAYYPWAVFYRKSLFSQRGYTVPEKLDDLVTLARQMARDGLTPLSFADKDGWEAMGTFDILNMRVNGYDYHVNLLAGKEGWDTAKTRKVFQTWRDLLPYHAPAPLGRTWQEAAQQLQQKKAGMYLFGMFVSEQFPATDQDDLDFFTFPEIDPAYGRDALDAPLDGFMMSHNPAHRDAARKLLESLAQPEAEEAYVNANPGEIAASGKADTSGYSVLQKKAAEVVSAAKHVGQYLDRDTRPDFASTVMIPSLQEFLRNPADINGITSRIEAQKKTVFATAG
ncbi:MAG: sugar ABC transporter substrate-binding protein [Actinobacteria bacterium 13_2_20CM_2_71_6]|nr:MAG: sugar ABC transporter substrate-binding protein [Actinobacteria bacterium 13_2_20CM_2_71_6]